MLALSFVKSCCALFSSCLELSKYFVNLVLTSALTSFPAIYFSASWLTVLDSKSLFDRVSLASWTSFDSKAFLSSFSFFSVDFSSSFSLESTLSVVSLAAFSSGFFGVSKLAESGFSSDFGFVSTLFAFPIMLSCFLSTGLSCISLCFPADSSSTLFTISVPTTSPACTSGTSDTLPT